MYSSADADLETSRTQTIAWAMCGSKREEGGFSQHFIGGFRDLKRNLLVQFSFFVYPVSPIQMKLVILAAKVLFSCLMLEEPFLTLLFFLSISSPELLQFWGCTWEAPDIICDSGNSTSCHFTTLIFQNQNWRMKEVIPWGTVGLW